jgi:dCTP deaminase
VVNSSSHKVDSSWNGRIILELYNSGKIPLALRPSMTIASMSFEKLNSSVIRKYDPLISEKYKELHGDIISKIILD